MTAARIPGTVRDHVHERDQGCVARQARFPPAAGLCFGRIEQDHIHPMGIGLKGPSVPLNLVDLCLWHHGWKTNHGKTARPLLDAYVQRKEAETDELADVPVR